MSSLLHELLPGKQDIAPPPLGSVRPAPLTA
jgi:hypothetical protein